MQEHANEFCRDQQCSRFIQEHINRCSQASLEDMEALWFAICRSELSFKDESERKKQSLMRDVFGNFVLQIVLEHGRPELRSLLFDSIF